MKAGAFLLGLAVVTGPAAAADDPICADRPGKSTPTCTVAPNHWQVETGLADWSLQKGGGERATSLALGETTFRIGLTDRSEFQVDVMPWQRATDTVGAIRRRASGVGDLKILYLQRLTAGEAPVELAVMPMVKIPTAKHSLGNGRVEEGVLIPVDMNIGKTPLSLGFTPEIDWAADADGHGHHAAMAQVASLGWQATNKLSLSAELWGQWDWDRAGTTREESVDGSVAYLVNKDLQLDGGANLGLNRNTPDVELYAGVAKRF